MFSRVTLVAIAFMLFSTTLLAEEASISDRVFSFDPVVGLENIRKYPVYSEDNIEPDRSDFIVVDQAFLSSKIGGRLAVVTLKNDAAGARTFNDNYIVAVFANGDKRFSSGAEFKAFGGDTVNYIFSFGDHTIPILYVYTVN